MALRKSHCKRGHLLSGDNLYISKDKGRHCKACKRLTDKLRIDKDRESYNQYHKDWRYKNWNNVIKTERKSDTKRYSKHTIYMRKYYPGYLKDIQNEVLTYYGNGKLSCVCCGENTSLLFLTIDHINGRTESEKKDAHSRGWMLKQRLRTAFRRTGKWPKGYQTLCWNCNSGQALNKGICPHKLIEKITIKQEWSSN